MNGDDQKLLKHTKHLVAFMVCIVRKWRVTQTLQFGQYPVVRDNAMAAAGFDVCTDTLYFSVIHDLAALMFDEGRKTPSLRTCMQILAQPGVELRFRGRFLSSAEGDGGPGVHCGDEFDAALHRLRTEVPGVLSGGDATACRRARDRYTAHFSLLENGNDYKRLDIQHFGLLWDTPNRLIKRLRPRIDDLCLVTQCGVQAWGAYAEQNEQISDQLAAVFGGRAGFMPDIEELTAQIEARSPLQANSGIWHEAPENEEKLAINIVKTDD